MRERLIELLKEADKKWFYREDQADYLIDNGVIVPLYPYGTRVYYISRNEDYDNAYYYVDSSNYSKHWLGVKRELFLTKEEAEAKLAELKGEVDGTD